MKFSIVFLTKAYDINLNTNELFDSILLSFYYFFAYVLKRVLYKFDLLRFYLHMCIKTIKLNKF